MKDAVMRLWERIQQLKPYRANQRYNDVHGNLLSAGNAYYAFFSLFPAAAIAAVVFGFALRGNPDLLARVGDALNQALPGFVKTTANPSGLVELKEPSISLLTIGGLVAAVSLVLSGMGWIGSFRDAIRASLGAPGSPGNVITDKLRDLGVFVGLGLAFLVSALLTSVLGAGTGWVSDHLGLGDHEAVVYVVGLLVGYAVDVGVLVLLLRVLSGVRLPWPDLRQAALVGALLLGIVKVFGTELISNATKNPLLGPVALVIGLLFWLNLVARLVLLSACWAYVDRSVPTPETEQATEADEAGQAAERADDAEQVDEKGDGPTQPAVTHTSVRVIPPAGASAGVVDPGTSRQRDRISLAVGVVLGIGATLTTRSLVRSLASRRRR